VSSYDLLVSTDGGPYVTWLSKTTATSATYQGVVGSTYAFSSVARDLAGNVELPPVTPDATTTLVPVGGLPGTPTGVAAVGGIAAATVSWSAPVGGGVATTGYVVTASPGGQTCTWSSGPLSCVVTGLTNGTTYTFTVRATNGALQGAPSAASNPVTPQAPAPGAGFIGLNPSRILDSRAARQVGPFSTPWQAATTRDVVVAGVAGVPADAQAVVLNVTVTGTTSGSYLSIWPKGKNRPTVSSLNWQAGWTIPNAVTVKVGEEGRISIFNFAGSADVIVDVVGYYSSGTGAGYSTLSPSRIVDSRPARQVGPFSTPWQAATTRDVVVAGVAGVPADAQAVVLNVTVTGTTSGSYLSIWPKGQDRPTVSSLNWQAGWTIPNAVTVKVGEDGKVSMFNYAGDAHVIVDVAGYFKSGTGAEFHPVDPVRIQDSRAGSPIGLYATAWGLETSRNVSVTGVGSVPVGANAVLLNVTVTGTTSDSYLSVWPKGQSRPTVSSLNWRAGWTIPNAVTGKVGADGAVSVFNNAGSTHVIADVAGWYG
jgi:hypothetical protein